MDGREHPDTRDEFDADVSDVRLPADALSTPLAGFPHERRRSSRQRLARLAIALSAGLLALAVVLGSIPAIRERVVGLLTPTPSLAPGADLVYLLPNPPGTTVLLDGHPLAQLPEPGDPHPLRLARGRHRLEWRNAAFPFLPLSCMVSVPHAGTESCPVIMTVFLTPLTPVRVIGPHFTLAALANDQRAVLVRATQEALDASRSSALVQSGERYFHTSAQGGTPQPITAAQPVRATLRFRFTRFQGLSGCDPAYVLIQPCRFPGQDCNFYCTVPAQALTSIGSKPEWLAAAVVQSLWDFTTSDGTVVASDQQEFQPNLFYIVLSITWDGVHWQVAPLLGHTPGLPVADDVVCGPARGWIAYGSQSLLSVLPGIQIKYASDAIPVEGCAVVVTGYEGTPTASPAPPSLYLERFGVLLAANDTAHGLWPELPRADATEQALAQHLAAQSQLSV
jgi:hypothetical protein